MKKNNPDATRFCFQPGAIFQGVVVPLGLILLCSCGFALVAYYYPWQVPLKWLRFLCHFAVFGGGFWAGKKCMRRAWFHGLLVGVACFLLFLWFGSSGPSLSTWAWWRTLLGLAFTGMFGGMLGGLAKDS